MKHKIVPISSWTAAELMRQAIPMVLTLATLVTTLAAREPSVAEATAIRGWNAARIVLDLDAGVDERAMLVSIGHHETRWRNLKSSACGPTQIEHPATWGSSCAAIMEDDAEGYHVALQVLRYARAACPGTWGRVLTAYVSGKCDVAPRKARELCEPTGLCDTVYKSFVTTKASI